MVRAASRYDPYPYEEHEPPSFDEVSLFGPAGAVRLAVTTLVGDVVHLGAVLRVGAAGVATRSCCRAEMDPAFAFSVGLAMELFSEDSESGPSASCGSVAATSSRRGSESWVG